MPYSGQGPLNFLSRWVPNGPSQDPLFALGLIQSIPNEWKRLIAHFKALFKPDEISIMYFWLGVSETSTRYTYEPRILGEKFRGILNIIGRTQVSISSSKVKSEKETLFRRRVFARHHYAYLQHWWMWLDLLFYWRKVELIHLYSLKISNLCVLLLLGRSFGDCCPARWLLLVQVNQINWS